MPAEIRIEQPFPEEQVAALMRMIGENAWLLPAWVELLSVRFEQPDNHRVSLRVTIKEEYRRIDLIVCPEWLLTDHRTRASDLRHEFIHALNDPLDRLADKLIDMIDDGDHGNPKLVAWAREEKRLACERATVDFEYAINRKLDGRR